MRPRLYASRTAGPGRSLFYCVIITLLAGCQPSGPESPYETYLQKLGAALPLAAPARRPTGLPQPPAATALQLEIPSAGLEKLAVLDLSGCAVQVNIVKRNSSLGRYAKPSQRLLLELEYLNLAPACITRLRDRGNHALANFLEQAWRHQRRQLPALIFNATLGSDEYRAFWLALPAPHEYPRVSSDAVSSALHTINNDVHRWLHGDYRAQNLDLELSLSAIAGGDGGALLGTLSRQRDWLATADLLLERKSPPGSRCSAGVPDTPAKGQPTTISRYFNSEIQPHATLLHHRHQELMPRFINLEQQLASALPRSYRNWMDDRSQQLSALVRAPERHQERLARIHRRCAANCAAPCPRAGNWLH